MKKYYSKQYKRYLNKKRSYNITILLIQLSILVGIIILWEILARQGIIDTFIMSSPSRIWQTIVSLYTTGGLIKHSITTLAEALIGFAIATIGGTIIAIILWWSVTIRKILEPYLVVLNSLPKIALGPIIIIWVGVGTSSIVTMDILIMIIITTITMLNTFCQVDTGKILLLKSMKANKLQILIKLILPSSIAEFISLLKINVGLTWVGTIMGEYLVSKAGLGYLIIYGSQVFNLDLVMASTIILCVLATIMYFVVALIEKIVNRKINY